MSGHFEELSPLDAWFLYLERPEAPLHIGGVYIFEGDSKVPGGRGALGMAETIEERLHLVPRYRQKVLFRPFNIGHPVWVDDPDFDLSYHVRRAALPHPGDEAQLREYAARVFARPLDKRKPLWEIYVIEGLEGGRVGMVNKVHHAMVDGISTVDIGSLLFDMQREPTEVPPPKRWKPRPGPDERTLLLSELPSLNPLRTLGALRSLNPAGLPGAVQKAAGAIMSSPWTGAASLAWSFLRPGQKLFFNEMIGPSRRIHHLKVPLDEIKSIKNAFGGTVNDVILAIVAEGMRSWLLDRGANVPDRLRVFAPVSVRDETQRYALGNRVSGMVVELPLGPMPPLTRLARVSAVTGDLKRSRQAIAAHTLTGLTDWAPATLHTLGGRMASLPQTQLQSVVNMVVTNVPGPQQPFYTGGAQMLDVWPLVAIYHTLAMNLALFSYNGNVHFGLLADRDLVPDLDRFAKRLERAAAEYRGLARRMELPPSRSRTAAARPTRPASNGRGRAASAAKRASRPRAARGSRTPQG
jgi:diacylglycerol O-acyltransferase / wax synthase